MIDPLGSGWILDSRLPAGIHDVTLTVDDGSGQIAQSTIRIEVSASAPLLILDSPEPGAVVNSDAPILFDFRQSYDPDGDSFNVTITSDIESEPMVENGTIELTLEQIEKSFGKGAVMRMSESSEIDETIQSIPTGSIGLDIALGIGGLPKGRIVEIFGAESAGKSTLALSCIAEAQKKGGQAAYIDVEHAMDPSYANKIGVNNQELLISQPNSAEEALEITDHLVRSGALDIIVVDSVAALVPRSELEGEMGDYHVGAQARLMSQALRKFCLLYTSPSPRDVEESRMPSSA